jgi:hypothetical protein
VAPLTLTARLPNILAGLSYISFHSNQFASGEIRGQITAVAESKLSPCSGSGSLGSLASPWSAFASRRRPDGDSPAYLQTIQAVAALLAIKGQHTPAKSVRTNDATLASLPRCDPSSRAVAQSARAWPRSRSSKPHPRASEASNGEDPGRR